MTGGLASERTKGPMPQAKGRTQPVKSNQVVVCCCSLLAVVVVGISRGETL